MPISNALDITCAWQHAINVAPNRKGPFGYVLDLSGLSGMILSKDIVVWNPLAGTSQTLLGDATVSCVGVIEKFTFGGDPGDPIRVTCFVSPENRTSVRAKLSRELINTKLRLRWVIVDYDEAAKAWFGAVELLDVTQLDGVIHTVDGALQIAIAGTPTAIGDSHELQVYRFEVELAPTPGRTAQLQFAFGQNQRIVTTWGDAD